MGLIVNDKLIGRLQKGQKIRQEPQCVPSETQLETILSSIGFKPPHDLATDSKSFSISGAHLMKDRFQKLYLGF